MMSEDFDDDALVYSNDEEFYYTKNFPKDLLKDIEEKQIQIYTGYYDPPTKGTKDSPTIYLLGRGKTSGKFKLKIQGFYPYCYVKSDEGTYKDYLGETVEKLIFKGMHPSRVANFRDLRRKKGFPLPYEADILFVRRFLIDMYDNFKSKEMIEPKIAILDIENDHPVSDRIIAYSINDPDEDIVYESKFDTEYPSEMSLNIIDILDKFDIVTGWNINFDIKEIEKDLEEINKFLDYARSGYEYSKDKYIEDFIKTKRRFPVNEIRYIFDMLIDKNYLKIENDVIKLGSRKFLHEIEKHIAILDALTVSKKMYAVEIRGKWNLGNVGTQLVGLDKIHLGAKNIRDLDEEELKEYNIRDVIIPELIDELLGGIQAHVILSWALQAILRDVVITAVVNDIALLRAYHKESIVLPSRHWDETGTEVKYKAAEPDARPGVYDGLIVTDLVHAYPWAVISKNVSPETKDESGENIVTYIGREEIPKTLRFNNNRSIFIETLKSIMDERSKIKKKLKKTNKESDEYKRLKSIDFALKTQAAAFSHGIFGWANSRMRDYEVADAITGIVRELINTIKGACDNIDRQWVYVHTDSCFVNAPKEEMDKVMDYLNDVITNYSKGSKVMPTLDVKGYYPIAYIHSPARNVLVPEGVSVDDDEHWEVTGCNFMRSEVPEELANIEIELIKRKMKGEPLDNIKKYLKKRVKKIVEIDSTELGLIKPLTKSINEYGRELKDGSYGGYPGHINALLRARDEFDYDVDVGEKFMVLPILTDETTGVRKIRRKKVDIAFPIETGLPENYMIDYEYYLRSNLWGKIHNLFDLKPRQLEKEIVDDEIKTLFEI